MTSFVRPRVPAHTAGLRCSWFYRNYTPTYRGFDTFFGSSGNYGGGGGYWEHTLAGAGRCGTSQHTFAKVRVRRCWWAAAGVAARSDGGGGIGGGGVGHCRA